MSTIGGGEEAGHFGRELLLVLEQKAVPGGPQVGVSHMLFASGLGSALESHFEHPTAD